MLYATAERRRFGRRHIHSSAEPAIRLLCLSSERLSGTVEVDEAWLGGLESGVHGRQTETKALIVVAAEEDAQGCRPRITAAGTHREWFVPYR